jgi:hypothetical protein
LDATPGSTATSKDGFALEAVGSKSVHVPLQPVGVMVLPPEPKLEPPVPTWPPPAPPPAPPFAVTEPPAPAAPEAALVPPLAVAPPVPEALQVQARYPEPLALQTCAPVAPVVQAHDADAPGMQTAPGVPPVPEVPPNPPPPRPPPQLATNNDNTDTSLSLTISVPLRPFEKLGQAERLISVTRRCRRRPSSSHRRVRPRAIQSDRIASTPSVVVAAPEVAGA